MNKNINKSKLYMIICICVLCISVLGSTVAYYRKVLFNMNASTITYGLDYYINYAKGQDITSAELGLVENYTSGASSDIELWKKDNTYNIYGHIYLDVNQMGTNLSNTSALKYTIVNNGHIMSSGTLKGSSSGKSVLALANIPLQTTKQLYTVYIWLDSNENPDASIEGETLSLTVRCEATMKPIDASVNLLNHINNLYIANYDSSKDISFADGTGMNYYAPSVSLMNDGLDSTGNMTNDPYVGNIRYYGSTPDNYIYFNCSDYSNQSASTCEKWRIIGIVDGKVKIIKEESIGNLAWDHDKNQGAITNTYSSNWETSSLQIMLNSSYYNGDTSGTITYYNSSWSSANLDMSTIGLKNDITREMISESIWYLGGYSSADIYSNQMYKYERTNSVGTTIYSGNPFTITAKAGLMYASDYGYATDLSKCKNNLSSYSNCANYYGNNWLYNNVSQWTVTARSDFSSSICVLNGSSIDCMYGVANSFSVRPVLYLEPKLAIAGGEGTSDNPYQIYVEPEPLTLLKHITNLYTTGNPSLITQSTSNDSYYYSYQDETNTWGLMNDGLKVAETSGTGATTITDTATLTSGKEGNIRYFGPNNKVNNYIYFNCETYPDTNCEVWRIIGIVDGKVKIIREESIGNLAWDHDKNQGATTNTYSNNWETSSLQLFLNGLYYNRNTTEKYTYLSGSNGTTETELNLVTIGIKNNTRSMISESIWYLGGKQMTNASGFFPKEMYSHERTNIIGTTIVNGNAYTINANIGIMYPSDYGYGTNLTNCNKNLYEYSSCKMNNWLSNSPSQWLITPYPFYKSYSWYIAPSGSVGSSDDVSQPNWGVRPVLYLEQSLLLSEVGDGSSGNPYRLQVS